MARLLALLLALFAGGVSAADGYAYGGVCYSDKRLANSAVAASLSSGDTHFHALSATSVARGFGLNQCYEATINGQSKIQCVHRSQVCFGTNTAASSCGPELVSLRDYDGVASVGNCDTLQSLTAADGVSLGWQVGGAFIAVAAIMFIAGIFKGLK